jgi:acetylornithine aminotransferase
MLALVLREDPSKLIASLRQKGLLVVAAAGNAIRFLPPLTVGISEIEKALIITEEALKNFPTRVSE